MKIFQGYDNEVKVGFFVSVAVVIFVTTIFSLHDGAALLRSEYELLLNVPTAEGISKGSVVQYMGIPIGNVSKIEIHPQSREPLVRMNIDRQFQSLITVGVTAIVKTQGALGDKFVLISPGESGGQTLQEGENIPLGESQDILSTLVKSGDRLETVFLVLDEMQSFAQNLNANSHHFNEILSASSGILNRAHHNQNLEKSLGHLTNILEKIDKGQGTLGALINDPALYNSLKNLLGGTTRNRYIKDAIRKSIQETN